MVAANRDEFFDRPSEAPALRRSGPRTILAPRDARAGGTWLGVNDAGVFAAVTNRRCANPDPERRSRGLVVMDALREPSAWQAASALAGAAAASYNPFNLFVSDGRRAFAVLYEQTPKLVELAPGAHVIGSVDPNSSVSPKVKRLLWRAEQVAGAPTDEVLDQLARICRGHDGSGDPLDDACVHTPTYGTRSSLLLRLARRPSERFLGYADGPPCTTAYDDLTPLLHELDRATGIGVGSATTRNAS